MDVRSLSSFSKGDIWLTDLPPGSGHEQFGSRPAIILRDVAENDLIVVIPATKQLSAENFAFTHIIQPTKQNGLDLESVALIFQIRSLDKARFKHRLGKLEKAGMDKIDGILKEMLRL